jgi:hypothetical protein
MVQYEIDELCYESFPCKHRLTIIDDNGIKSEKLYYSFELARLIVENKIPISNELYKHFRYDLENNNTKLYEDKHNLSYDPEFDKLESRNHALRCYYQIFEPSLKYSDKK